MGDTQQVFSHEKFFENSICKKGKISVAIVDKNEKKP
jgi:hypothetical protein